MTKLKAGVIMKIMKIMSHANESLSPHMCLWRYLHSSHTDLQDDAQL